MAGGKFVVSGGKRRLESEERPKKKLKKGLKGGKNAKDEEEDSEPKFESMKEFMVPIEYKESASDNYSWEDVPIDPKVGGLMAIQSHFLLPCTQPSSSSSPSSASSSTGTWSRLLPPASRLLPPSCPSKAWPRY